MDATIKPIQHCEGCGWLVSEVGQVLCAVCWQDKRNRERGRYVRLQKQMPDGTIHWFETMMDACGQTKFLAICHTCQGPDVEAALLQCLPGRIPYTEFEAWKKFMLKDGCVEV